MSPSEEEDVERMRGFESRKLLRLMVKFESENASVVRPLSATDPRIISRGGDIQRLTIDYLQGILRVSIYTIKQIKVSLKGRSKGKSK